MQDKTIVYSYLDAEVKAQNISSTPASKSLVRNETTETTLSTSTSSHNTKEANSTSSPRDHLNHTNVVTFIPTSGGFHPTSGGMVTDGMLQRSLYVVSRMYSKLQVLVKQ